MVSPAPSLAAEASPVRVLLLSGQNNHDWRTTTPELERVLKASGRFAVEITEHPEQVDAAVLARFDVVLSNWNCFHRDTPPPVIEWPADVRKAYEGFVRNGGGFAVVHAGGSSFYKHPWPAYEEMVIARYGFGQTAHGVQHAFDVQIVDSDHPITRGMGDFVQHDELWHRPLVAPGAGVLARVFSAAEEGGSGDYEPSAFVRNFGEGRCFTTLLGHGVRGLRNPAFGALLCRGVEWAGTGEVTIPLPDTWPTTTNAVESLATPLDAALAAIANWKFGDSPAPLRAISGFVSDASDDSAAARELADRLVIVLGTASSSAGKRFLCDQLGLVGSAEHVGAVAALLGDDELSVSARGALERIGGPAAFGALRSALASAAGQQRTGMLHGLAAIGGDDVVTVLCEFAADSYDIDTRAAAWNALAGLGTAAAADGMLETSPRSEGAPEAAFWSDAALGCAATLRSATEDAGAAQLYDRILELNASIPSVRAARVGRLTCPDSWGRGDVWRTLKSPDSEERRAALDAIRTAGATAEFVRLAELLPELDPEWQIETTYLIAEKHATAARTAVARILSAESPEVRIAAIRALARIGDGQSASALLALADSADASKSNEIVSALSAIADTGLDDLLIRALADASANRAVILARALTERSATAAIPALMKLVRSSADDAASEAAIKAVGELGAGPECETLLSTLAEGASETLRPALRSAIVLTGRRSDGNPADRVIARLSAASGEATPDLLEILGALGGAGALDAVARYLDESAPPIRLAAYRTLSNWSDPSALRILARAAAQDDDRLRMLTIRGFARLLPQAGKYPQPDLATLFVKIASAARTPAECKTLLGCASAVPAEAVLDWTLAQRSVDENRREAGVAVLALCDAMGDSRPDAVRGALRSLVTATDDSASRVEALRRLARAGALRNLAREAIADSPDDWKPDFGGREAPAVNDGDLGTYWDEENGKPLYRLRLTFPEPVTIAVMSITAYRQDYAAPHTFSILRDGEPYHTVNNLAYTDAVAIVEFPPAEFSSLTLEITGYHAPSPGIRELELFGPEFEAAASGYAWLRTPDSLSLQQDGRVVWTFHFGEQVAKPYFHPLSLPGGDAVTWQEPADHIWHHGLWFSWKFINGVNYWEENPQTRRSDGLTKIRSVTAEARDDFSADMVLELEYAPAKGDPVLAEMREIHVSPPDEAGHYFIDWNSEFRAVQDVVLDRTPLPDEPGGKVYGGYGGLAFRFAERYAIAGMLTPDGPITEWKDERFRGRAPGLAVNGEIGGRRVGVAVLDNPGNFNAPTPWYAIHSNPMRYVNPAVLCFSPAKFRVGEAFSLHYRIVLCSENWTTQSLQKATDKYAGESSSASLPRTGKP